MSIVGVGNPYGSLANGGYGRDDVLDEFEDFGIYPTSIGGGHLGQADTVWSPARGYTVRDGRQPISWDMGDAELQMQAERAMLDEMYPDAVTVEERIGQPRLIGSRVLDESWVYFRRPFEMVEKLVEVPQVIVKQIEREVPCPEIVERRIEVPKLEYIQTYRQAPTKHVTKEQIVEVPEVAVEEHVRHVPRREVQERLFEIPKVEYRETIEYEDRVEYREVIVDKIVEVPEVEYRIEPVEHWVPQRYVEEVEASVSYQEVPMLQIQEVERHEFAPILTPAEHFHAAGNPMGVGLQAGCRKSAGYGNAVGHVANAYANYRPDERLR